MSPADDLAKIESLPSKHDYRLRLPPTLRVALVALAQAEGIDLHTLLVELIHEALSARLRRG